MLDNALIILIRTNLLAGYAERGYPAVKVLQNFQTTQQGRVDGPVCYLHKILDKRHGSPSVKQVWDSGANTFIEVESQVIESTYQFSFLSPELPSDLSGPTTSDYAKIGASIMQREAFQAALRVGGADIQRITDIRTDNVQNDREQFEKRPSFDVVFNFVDVYSATANRIDHTNLNIYRV